MIFQNKCLQVTDLIPEKYRDDEEIIRLTVEQLTKDLGSLSPEFVFSGQKDTMFVELAIQVAEVLARIRKANPALLRVLLYRVDIREGEVSGSADPNSLKILAEKIIQREFQKVLTRRFFSEKGK